MEKAKFIIYSVDENIKRFVPVDCIGIVVAYTETSRLNGAKEYGICLANKYGDGEQRMNFKTETQRDEKLAEILEKISQR